MLRKLDFPRGILVPRGRATFGQHQDRGRGRYVMYGELYCPQYNYDTVLTLLKCLSNDPGKNCTIFYCSDAISFPHIETVVFLGEEFLN